MDGCLFLEWVTPLPFLDRQVMALNKGYTTDTLILLLFFWIQDVISNGFHSIQREMLKKNILLFCFNESIHLSLVLMPIFLPYFSYFWAKSFDTIYSEADVAWDCTSKCFHFRCRDSSTSTWNAFSLSISGVPLDLFPLIHSQQIMSCVLHWVVYVCILEKENNVHQSCGLWHVVLQTLVWVDWLLVLNWEPLQLQGTHGRHVSLGVHC